MIPDRLWNGGLTLARDLCRHGGSPEVLPLRDMVIPFKLSSPVDG
jgi:hypothetical protein